MKHLLLPASILIVSFLNGNSFSISNSLPNDLQSAANVFSKSVEVFGLRVLSTNSVSDAKVLHTANVLAEYLDNDENGSVDQPSVLTKLLGNSKAEIATMVLFASESEQASFEDSLGPLMTVLTKTQNLFANEIFENGSSGNNRDATLEEVLHLVTDLGWDEAFPTIWGEQAGSSIADAMDSARGGYFETVPTQYPAQAWYTYYDDTSDYPTQITEYVYWATTTYLGGQNWEGRNHSNFTNEWKPYTKEMLQQSDPAVVSILTSNNYNFPITQLPDGNYSVPVKTSSNILPNASYLGSANWYESSWFGTFFESTNSWLYHANLGWLYIPSSTTNNLWIYSPDLKWLWTTAPFYPWLYVSELKEWRYYSNQKGFYDPNTKQWLKKSDLIAQFYSSSYTSASYSSGDLVSNNNLSEWFDRSLEINGLMLVVAGQVGGQIALPEEWAKKVAQTVKLLTDPNSEGIDISSQEQMIKVLKGETGTWHAGFSTVQRIAYGGGGATIVRTHSLIQEDRAI